MINLAMQLVDDLKEVKLKAGRDGYGDGLLILGEKDERVVVLCADLKGSTRSKAFADEFPKRFFEMGVAEQNMMGVAAGMALSDKVPFVSSYAVFSPGRNWEQLRVSVCYSEANVKVAGAHAGINVGPDGATHQALEDLAITRVLPNLIVVAPCDYEQTKKTTIAVAQHSGPVYFRFGKNKTACFTTRATPFEIGKAQILREGSEVSVFACGPLVYEALMAAEELKDEASVEVVNVHTIKPIDQEVLVRSAKKTGKVVVVEEHQIMGGLAGAVAEVLGERQPTLMRRVGVRDVFGESGEAEELLKKHGMDRGAIIKTVREMI